VPHVAFDAGEDPREGRGNGNAAAPGAHGGRRAAFGWLALLAGVGLIGAVNLAPRILTVMKLERQKAVSQHRLVALERQTARMRDIAESLRRDPEFVNRAAAAATAGRTESYASGGEERIVVEETLRIDGLSPEFERPTEVEKLPAWTGWIERLARDPRLALSLSAWGAVLVLLSFVVGPREFPTAAASAAGPPAPHRRAVRREGTRRYHRVDGPTV